MHGQDNANHLRIMSNRSARVTGIQQELGGRVKEGVGGGVNSRASGIV